MGVFSRFKDIVGSNLNVLLDKAEDPRKLIRLMVREMEETLVELKASCAKTMAERKNLEREREAITEQTEKWAARAELAVDKGRDDLAREALVEKSAFVRRLDALDEEALYMDGLVEQAREDISRLEDKMHAAREKQRLLEQRHARATQRRSAGRTLTRVESSDVMLRFDRFENRIEHLEAEAELAAPKQRLDLEDEFSLLEKEDSIKDELSALKKSRKPAGGKVEKKD
ncbi:phage shock protein PspA [Desulfovibrio ferrophilus]|uniref:Phage shock protein A, PspA n=1 Tax=Desulfovibrio ferrophilus TaxID=241368 RepID=A0A2Z6AU83_9BACT|nr:phage shock protein PspA [Desulfovibrio ferrophilus]BBD06785.1 phage shock protein A, PspA [Desulfovibrio ferrophilus]